MLFCYGRLNYTFFSAVFQVRSEEFIEMWKGEGLKENRVFIQIHSTLITPHCSTSSESAFNMYFYRMASGGIIFTITNTK